MGPLIFEFSIWQFAPILTSPLTELSVIDPLLSPWILSKTSRLASNKSDGWPVSFHQPVISEYVISKSFSGKTRVEQHKMVYDAFNGKMGSDLHALKLKTVSE